MNVKCFLLEPTDQVSQYLRRYGSYEDKCPVNSSYHNARVFIGDQPAALCRHIDGQPVHGDVYPHADPSWPTHCGCGYRFKDTDAWQYSPETIYACKANGLRTTLREAPVGAMWWATWLEDTDFVGLDGKSLVVRLPNNHDWHVDSRAGNCTLPKDRVHKCWCRHGAAPLITVDKNGHTCSAGAGSIQTSNWHGFLRNGYLTE